MRLDRSVIWALYAWPDQRNVRHEARVYLRAARLLVGDQLTTSGEELKAHIMALSFDDHEGLCAAIKSVWSRHRSSERTRQSWALMANCSVDDLAPARWETSIIERLIWSMEARACCSKTR